MTEEERFTGHIQDLAQRSLRESIYTFTGFLGEAELSCLLGMEKELRHAGVRLFGGTENAGRCIARFGDPKELGYDLEFPVVCLRIDPCALKFAEDLSHRDYLGAVMNLGIERDLLGDIYIDGKTAYLFCMDHIAEYLIQNLTRVRHTNVRVTETSQLPENVGPRLESRGIVAASARLDAVIAGLYHLSRNQSQSLFRAGRVFLNGLEHEHPGTVCKEGDRISVRGHGKFIFDEVEGTTGKGRCRIRLRIFC